MNRRAALSTYILAAECGDGRRPGVVESIQKFIGLLASDRPWRIRVDPAVTDRSEVQNNYLWLCYGILEAETGYRKGDWHAFFCEQAFGTRAVELPGGGSRQEPIRTTTTDENGRKALLTTVEFHDFTERVLAEAGARGLYIPPPDPSLRSYR